MKYRILGKTNLKVAEISLGTWQITDDPEWGKGPSETHSFSILQRYIDLGGNLIDTAWIYGFREDQPSSHPSEELVGKFLAQKRLRDKVLITTKIPPLNFTWPIPQGTTMENSFPRKHILKCVDDSLRGLRTNYIDLMLFHAWRDEFNQESKWKETCQQLTKAGKVRFWGLSPNYYEPSGCIHTLKSGLISVVQCIFNIFHQKPIADIFPIAQKLNIGLMACVPFDEGGLTGNININTRFETDDFRSQYFSGQRLKELDTHTTKLKALLGSESNSLPELALRFILSFDSISTAVIGTRKLQNLESNISVSDGRKLSLLLLNKLKKHTWERNFYPWAS